MFKPTEFPSQAKLQAAMKSDIEDMQQIFDKKQLSPTFLADKTRLTYAALSMKSLWLSRMKKLDRKLKANANKESMEKDEN
jgi:hypothetical protein